VLDEVKTESSDRIDAGEDASSGLSRPLVAGGAVAVALAAAVGAWFLWSRAGVLPTPTIAPLATYRGIELQPALSPDGTQVAFRWDGEQQNNIDIYIKPVDAVTPLRLTSDPAADL
jgi:hypothetical protein